MRTAFALAVLLLVAEPAGAFRTLGAPDCGQWNEARDSLKMQHRMWLLGFLSGLNAVKVSPEERNDWLKRVPGAEQAFVWFDEYCTVHADGTLVDGALEFAEGLQGIRP